MADAAECLEEGHARLAPIPSFKRCLARQGLGRRAVEDEHRHGHYLTLEPCRHSIGLHHRSSHADHHLVPALHHVILLWRVRRGVVSHHTLIRAVRSELNRSEFAAAISPQHAELLAALGLRAHLELLDRRQRFVLACLELQPYVATTIIHEQEEVPPTTVYGWRDWLTEIVVDEFESVHRVILGRLWEWQPPMLPS